MKHPRSAFGAFPSKRRFQRTGEAGSAVAAGRIHVPICMRVAIFACAAVLALPAAAADDSGRHERERIARERAAASARYAEQERECHRRFVVTNCIEAAQVERRETMEHLRAQQRVLDEADRKRRAAERMQAIRDRIEQAPGAPPPMEISAPRGSGSAGSSGSSGSASSPAPGHRHRAKRPPLESAERAEREQAARERYEERQREGEQRRAENERRNAERKGPNAQPSAPLPVPADVPQPRP